MTVKIQAVHFSADQKLINFIEERLEKLTLFYDGIISSDVILRVEADGQENKLAEIKLHVSGTDLFVKKQCKSFEEAIDVGADALKVQLLKRKEKIKSK